MTDYDRDYLNRLFGQHDPEPDLPAPNPDDEPDEMRTYVRELFRSDTND